MKEPYRWYWHPYMGWLDLLLGIAVYYMLPLKQVMMENDPDKVTEQSQQIRSNLSTLGLSITEKALKKWGTYMGCDILQYNHVVPRRSSVLLEWGIIETPREPPSDTPPISVRMHMPESALKGIQYELASDPSSNSLSCPLIDVDISQLNKDIPIVLVLHGGGFHMGDSMDAAIELMTALAQLNRQQPFLCAFFTYRQIPEHCFPAAIEDVLAVALDLLERCSSIHIVGFSAGANLATVASMELHRRYPGRVRSATLLCPMLNPAANSMSYYMNQNVWFVSPEWLRWCWRNYLGLPAPSSNTESSLPDLDHGSNKTAWEASAYHNSPLARFIHPTVDLPEGLDDLNTTQFIVTTNEADPLCEDGKQLVAQLQKRGAHVKHLQHSGSHWLGTATDVSGQMAQLVQEMTRVLFPLCS